MRAQGAGTIVMVTSLAAAFSTYGEGAYAASKRALEGAAEVLQNEAARWGIRVLVIRPGYVATPIAGKSLPGSASPPDSPYRELIRLYGEQDEQGFFDRETCRLGAAQNPFGAKVLPMSPV